MSGFLGGLAQIAVPTNLFALAALGLLSGQNAARMPSVTLTAFALGLFAGSVLSRSPCAIRRRHPVCSRLRRSPA